MSERKELGANSKEQVRLFANQVEARIIDGKDKLIGEDERLWLRGIVEAKGISLDGLGEKFVRKNGKKTGTLTNQTASLEKALGGRGNLDMLVQEIFDRLTKNKTEETSNFVATYLKSHTGDDGLVIYTGNDSDLNRTRLEAIMSVTHRMLKILGAASEEKSLEFQGDESALKHLRERVMRGWEKKKINKETDKRVVKLSPGIKRDEEKIIRSLPIGGIEVILEILTK